MSGRLVRWVLSLAHRRRPGRVPRLTVVRHHRVFGPGERPLYRIGVSEAVLEAQVATFARAGLVPVTVAEGLARLAEGAPHTVAFSFDDGYRDNVERAVPVLARHGARGTFYLTAGLMEDRVAPWWDEAEHLFATTRAPALRWSVEDASFDLPLGGPAARAHALSAVLGCLRVPPARQRERLAGLAAALGVTPGAPCTLATWGEVARFAEAGMEVGAHTLTHPFLSLLDREGQRAEIAGSIALIERRLGLRPAGLAYPGGDHDDVTVEVARAAGLAHAVTTRRGDVARGDDPHRLLRRGLSEGACLGPGGAFSARLLLAEADGAFDRLRGSVKEAAA